MEHSTSFAAANRFIEENYDRRLRGVGLMKTMRIARVVAAIQLLFGVALVAGGLYLLGLTRAAEMRISRDAERAIGGLYTAAALFLPLGVVMLIGGTAMWKNKLWGWWLAVI